MPVMNRTTEDLLDFVDTAAIGLHSVNHAVVTDQPVGRAPVAAQYDWLRRAARLWLALVLRLQNFQQQHCMKYWENKAICHLP